MKKRFRVVLVGFVVAILSTILVAGMVLAARSGMDIVSVSYNRDAAPNENAITVMHTSGKITFVKGNEFIPSGSFPTLADLEAEIDATMSERYERWERLNSYPSDDPVRQDPPILHDNQEIRYIRNTPYLVDTAVYFDIHIYSLDDIGTPENELNFTTRFGNRAPTGQWW